MDTATKTEVDAAKTASERVVQKTYYSDAYIVVKGDITLQ